MRRTAAAALFVLAAGCGGGDNPGGPSPTPAVPYQGERQFCLDQTNTYRASVGRPALRHSVLLQEYADRAAEYDGTNHVGHGYFRMTGGGGVATAENELPWWGLSTFGTLQRLLQAGLNGFWGEGPGGGHYENIRGPYSELGCGIFVNGSQITVVQAFR
jgi:uncharacterized protein YkwD